MEEKESVLKRIKVKIQQWKQEGYEINELERMIESLENQSLQNISEEGAVIRKNVRSRIHMAIEIENKKQLNDQIKVLNELSHQYENDSKLANTETDKSWCYINSITCQLQKLLAERTWIKKVEVPKANSNEELISLFETEKNLLSEMIEIAKKRVEKINEMDMASEDMSLRQNFYMLELITYKAAFHNNLGKINKLNRNYKDSKQKFKRALDVCNKALIYASNASEADVGEFFDAYFDEMHSVFYDEYETAENESH